MTAAPLRLASLDQTIAVDPYGYVALVMPPDEFRAGWDLGGGAAVLGRTHWGEALVFTGAPEDVRRHALAVLAESVEITGGPIPRITIPAGAADVIEWVSRSEWSWAKTTTPPPVQRHENDVFFTANVELINAFLDEANPDASTRPGDPEVEVWAAIADPSDASRLAAAAAIVQWRNGGRVMVSVATRPDCRGRGYAAAVSARLTRHVLDAGHGQVALGYYTANAAAEALYTKLGYTTYARNVSGWLTEPPEH